MFFAIIGPSSNKWHSEKFVYCNDTEFIGKRSWYAKLQMRSETI